MIISKYLKALYIFAIVLLLGIVLSLTFQYDRIFKNATMYIETMERKDVSVFAKNIEKILRDHFKDSLKNPLNLDKEIRKHTEDVLRLFVGEEYQYVYVITKDKAQKFRYVLDASLTEEERGEYRQKFDPISDIWDKAFLSGEEQWKTQNSLDQLWVTYLKPVIIDDKVAMVIAFDFSKSSYEEYSCMFEPMRKYLLIITVLIISVLVLVYVVFFLLIKQKEKTVRDPLTKAYNRHYLTRIESKLKLDTIVLVFLDIDHFKKVNDNYGHEVGDVVLKTLSRRLKNNLKEDDVLIRYGGEEFLIILEKAETKDADMVKVVSRIHSNVCKENIIVEGKSLHVTFSAGVNISPDKSKSFHDALAKADLALYKAKNEGRNRIEVLE